MFTIYFEKNYDYSQTSHNVYSTFYVNLNGVNFPDNQWFDFPVSVLIMWCENLLSNKASFTLYFMDGPYYIECQHTNDIVNMRLMENRTTPKVIMDGIIPYEDLKSSILGASVNLTVSVNQTVAGKVDDIEKLAQLIKNLKQN